MPPTAPLLTRPAAPPSWVGDPLILVYAVRHAITLPPASHICRFVLQSVEANVDHLSWAGRRTIARDIGAWLDGPGADRVEDIDPRECPHAGSALAPQAGDGAR